MVIFSKTPALASTHRLRPFPTITVWPTDLRYSITFFLIGGKSAARGPLHFHPKIAGGDIKIGYPSGYPPLPSAVSPRYRTLLTVGDRKNQSVRIFGPKPVHKPHLFECSECLKRYVFDTPVSDWAFLRLIFSLHFCIIKLHNLKIFRIVCRGFYFNAAGPVPEVTSSIASSVVSAPEASSDRRA